MPCTSDSTGLCLWERQDVGTSVATVQAESRDGHDAERHQLQCEHVGVRKGRAIPDSAAAQRDARDGSSQALHVYSMEKPAHSVGYEDRPKPSTQSIIETVKTNFVIAGDAATLHSSPSSKRMLQKCMSSVLFVVAVVTPFALTLYATTSWALSIEFIFVLILVPAILCSLIAAVLTRLYDHNSYLERERILDIPIVNFFYATFFCVCPDLDHIVQVLDLIILSCSLMAGCVFTMLTAVDHEELRQMDEMWQHGEYSCMKVQGQSFGEGDTMSVSEYMLSEFALSMCSYLYAFVTAFLTRVAAITLPQETSIPDQRTLKAWWVVVRPLIFVSYTLTLVGLVAMMYMVGGIVLIKFPQRRLAAWCEVEEEVAFRDVWLRWSVDMLDSGHTYTPLNYYGVHILVSAFLAIYGGMMCLGYASRRAYAVFVCNQTSMSDSKNHSMEAKAEKAFSDLETCRDALGTCCQLLEKLVEQKQ